MVLYTIYMRYLFLLFLFFPLKSQAFQQDTIYLSENVKQIVKGKEFYFFSEEDLPISQIIGKEFKPKTQINLAYVTGWVWVKFILKNNSDTERFIFHTSDGHIAGFYMYKPSSKGYEMTPPGLHHPEDGREVFNRIPAFFLTLKKNESRIFYLKISTLNEIVSFKYIIQNKQQFLESIQTDMIIIGSYFGALLIMIVINIFYFISLKDSIFLIYAVYVLASLMFTATLNGFTWLLIPDPDLAYHLCFFCLRFWPDSLLFFTTRLVNLRTHHRSLTIFCYVFIFYHTIMMAILESINFLNMKEKLMAQWETINWGIGIILIISVVILSYKNNRYLFKYYLIAYGVLFIVGIFAFMHSLSAENWLIFEHGIKAGTLAEIITLSFAVSRRFKYTENDLKNKEEQEKRLNEKVKQLEMDVRKAQMNPGFMFNALTSIEYFIFKNDSKKARNYLSKFAQLMRLTLDNSRSTYITLADEINTLKFYIELEFLRLKNYSHRFEIDIDNEINTETILVPPLLIQPFVENAIWHGLQKMESSGILSIRIYFSQHDLICKIVDNGGGIVETMATSNKKSSGIMLTKERLNLIHAVLKTNYTFTIESIKERENTLTGTAVEFNLPYVRG